jgi:hypothetical protein
MFHFFFLFFFFISPLSNPKTSQMLKQQRKVTVLRRFAGALQNHFHQQGLKASLNREVVVGDTSKLSLLDPLPLVENWMESSPVLIELHNVIVVSLKEKELALPVVEV